MGFLGDFFRAIWDVLVDFVRKIIELFKILFNDVIAWFKRHFMKNKKPITVTVPDEYIRDKMRKPHKIVKVMWDAETETIADAEEVHADEMDEQMTRHHRNADLVEYDIRG
ncbi:MAG: hypothetical protein LBG73_01395 [Spirochaetaceae bacterium]|jgi:hypothetical protein|nr:hypothetical protein [Spirochaetaceae bacterium]